MASVVLTSDASLAVTKSAISAGEQITADIDPTIANEPDDELVERIDDPFVWVCIVVEFITDVVWNNGRPKSDKSQHRIVVQFAVDPGNICTAVDWTERRAKPVKIFLPSSLISDAGATMAVEVWEFQSDVNRDLIGHRRTDIHEMLKGNLTTLELTKRQGRTCCGKIGLSVTLDRDFGGVINGGQAQSTGRLILMVLECQGLHQESDLAVTMSLSSGEIDRALQSHAVMYDENRGAFIWNHCFSFQISSSAIKKYSALISMINVTAMDRAIGTVTFPLASLTSNEQGFSAWLPIHSVATRDETLNARIRVACVFLPDISEDVVLCAPEIENINRPMIHSLSHPMNMMDLLLPLGSVLEVKIKYICSTSPTEAQLIRELLRADKDVHQISVRGRIHLAGGDIQRAVTSALLKLESKHCEGKVCAQLVGNDGGPIVLRLELNPDVMTNVHPYFSFEIRLKGLQKWRASSWIALPHILKKLSVGVEHQYALRLIDQEGRVCSQLQVSFRGGLEVDLLNKHQHWTTNVHEPHSCAITMTITDVFAPRGAIRNAQYYAKIWSMNGKSEAQTISPLAWGSGDSSSEKVEAHSVSFKVGDISTEIIFVSVHRFSAHERNELLGTGSFNLCGVPVPDGRGDVSFSTERNVPLYAESTSSEEKCGSVTLALQLFRVGNNSEEGTSISLAAAGLGSIAYPGQSGDMRCRFDFDVIEVRCLPSNVSEGDIIFIQLRIAQSNWKRDLATTKVVSGENGTTFASFGDKPHKVVCWTAKDRSFPVLEISLYSQPPKQNSRMKTTSRASLAPSQQTKDRTDWRQILKLNHKANGVVAPVLLATGCLNLSSLFFQLNVWVPFEMQLTATQGINEKDLEKARSIVRVTMNLRASPCQEYGGKEPIALDICSSVQQSVKGDVCIHLLQATGSFLKKIDLMTKYYISISLGSEVVTSSCCAAGDTLTWNEHLTLPMVCVSPPIIQLTIYQQRTEAFANAPEEEQASSQQLHEDQIIGCLSLPIFPSVLERGHLLQLELPFGTSYEMDLGKGAKDPYYYKRGMLSLEVQFLASDQQKILSRTPNENFELVIHQVRGNLDANSPVGSSPGSAQSVFIDVSLMTDRNGTADDLAVGTTNLISLSPTGFTKTSEVIDLSNPTVATILLENRSSVIVAKIRDLSGNYLGRVHLPLRRSWRERLVHIKKQCWYSICVDSKDTEAKLTKDALLMSLQVRQQGSQASSTNALGRVYVCIKEAVLEYSSDSDLFKLGKCSGASVQLTWVATDNKDSKRFRTRQSTDQDNSHHWRWSDEWFSITHESESNTLEDMQISLHIEAQAKRPQLRGTVNLLSAMEDATLKRLDQWIVLTDLQDGGGINAHLHLVIVYIPTIAGTIRMEFGKSHIFSESMSLLHLGKSFFKCTYCGTNYTTSSKPKDNSQNGVSSHNDKQLLLPFDSRLDDVSSGPPEFSIQWIGATKTLGEICLGVFSIDILSISDHCCFTNPSANIVRSSFSWCEFLSKSDDRQIAGVVRLGFAFNPAHHTARMQNPHTLPTVGARVASAETFAIWKKMFYLLDQNNNGVIDHKEFTDVFVHHLDDLANTFDGQKLLHLLFGEDNQENHRNGKTVPTQQELTALFSAIDTNNDGEIEWTEYLRFLQRQQVQMYSTSSANGKNENVCPSDNPEVPSPRIEQTRELRKKYREERCETSLKFSGNFAEGNQPELTLTKSSNSSRTSNNAIGQLSSTQCHWANASSSKESLWKLHQSSQEQIRLHQQVASLESILTLERRRFAELAADRQALMRSYQQLHLKHQNDLIQEQTKAKWMKQTIERQQQQLEEREALRQRHNHASVVLQSTVRSRLEQKRYHGLKLERANAAITIQCMARRMKAKRRLRMLQEIDRMAKQHKRAASMLQNFARYHLHRKEQILMQEARKISATILQKNARRLIACHSWSRKRMATLRLQCWTRQRLAIQHVKHLRGTAGILKGVLLGWMARWQYGRVKRASRKIQRWWRSVSNERSLFHERLEAAICIQSAWKRRTTRVWFKRERQRQDKFIAEIEATICIQAAWRGRLERVNRPRPLEVTSQLGSTVVTPDISDIADFACFNGGGVECIPRSAEPDDISYSNNFTGDMNCGMDDNAVILSVLSQITQRVVDAAATCNLQHDTSEFAQNVEELQVGTVADELIGSITSCPSVEANDTTGIFLDQTERFKETDVNGSPAMSKLTDADIFIIQNMLDDLTESVFIRATTTLESKLTMPFSGASDDHAPLGPCPDNACETKLDLNRLGLRINGEGNQQHVTFDTSLGGDDLQNGATSTDNTEGGVGIPGVNAGLSASIDDTSSLNGDDIKQLTVSEDSAANADGGADEMEAKMPSQPAPTHLPKLSEAPRSSSNRLFDAPQGSDAFKMIRATTINDESDTLVGVSTSEDNGLGKGRHKPGGMPIESTEDLQLKQDAQDVMAATPSLDSDKITPEKPQEISDGAAAQTHTKTSTLEPMIFTARSSALDSGENGGGNASMDSTDLMMEADVMASMIDSVGGDGETTAYDSKHRHRFKRLDSLTLLSDFHQLEEQGSEKLITEFPEQPVVDVRKESDSADRTNVE